MADFKEGPGDIVRRVLAGVPADVRAALPQVDLLRRMVKRSRKSSGKTLLGHMANSELLEDPSCYKEEEEVEEERFLSHPEGQAPTSEELTDL